MNIPREFFYARPLFNPRDSDNKLFDRLDNGTADNHDLQLAYALAQFKVEAYYTEADRDAALGMTHLPICKYVAASRDEAIKDSRIDQQIACGYRFGHPHYDKVLRALFPERVRALLADFDDRKPDADGKATVDFVIGRLTYRLQMTQTPPSTMIFFDFKVMPWMGDEQPHDLIDQTGNDLLKRLNELFLKARGGSLLQGDAGHG